MTVENYDNFNEFLTKIFTFHVNDVWFNMIPTDAVDGDMTIMLKKFDRDKWTDIPEFKVSEIETANLRQYLTEEEYNKVIQKLFDVL